MNEHEHVRAFGGPFCAVCGVHIGFQAEPSPSRARPSDRAIAQAFWESRGDTADCDWIAVRARQIDSEGAPVERWTSDDEVRYLLGLIEEHGDGESEYSLRAQHMMADIRRRLSTQPETPEARAGDCLTGPLDPEGLIQQFQGDARLMPQTIVALARELLTTKATP